MIPWQPICVGTSRVARWHRSNASARTKFHYFGGVVCPLHRCGAPDQATTSEERPGGQSHPPLAQGRLRPLRFTRQGFSAVQGSLATVARFMPDRCGRTYVLRFRRRFGVLAMATVVIGAMLPAVAASAAVPGRTFISGETNFDSTVYKSVRVFCPSGLQVIGGGYKLVGAEGAVVLDDFIPSADNLLVGAGEI